MALQGGTSPLQHEYLRAAARDAALAGETGFAQGGSAAAMLSASDTIRVASFEIADHYDLHLAKHGIDGAFPGRHSLIQGDSRETLPAWDGPLFDLFFVDGDHSYDGAMSDLVNALAMTRPGGLIVIDDLTPWKPWGEGPAAAWLRFTARGSVTAVSLFADPPGDRVWAAGLVP